jgi:hypothetical protein
MLGLWEQYGQKNMGYSHADYVALVEEVAGRRWMSTSRRASRVPGRCTNGWRRHLGHVACGLEVTPQPGDAGNVQVRIVPGPETESLRKWLGQPARGKREARKMT